jgi:hypothetical protein
MWNLRLLLLVIACISSSFSVYVNQMQVELEDGQIVEIGDASLSFNYVPGTKWQLARIEFLHGIFSSEDYDKSSRAEYLISRILRTAFLSDRLSIVIFGEEIKNLNFRREEDGFIKYSIAVGSLRGKANLLFSLDKAETPYDEILIDIINHKDSI